MTRKVQIIGILCLVATLGCAVAQGNEEAETAAVEAAEQWTQQISAVRAPLGKVTSREVKKATYAKSLPGAPDGEYVVIQTKASFENKASAIETITPMLDKNGKWRVSGYFIK